MRNSQANKSFDLSEKLNLNLINKWSETQGFYCILTMRLIILKTINDKKVLTSDVNYILYCPLAVMSMCSCQQYPFHRFGIVFPEQVNAFLKLGPFAATGFFIFLCFFLTFTHLSHLKLNPILLHTLTVALALSWYQWTV